MNKCRQIIHTFIKLAGIIMFVLVIGIYGFLTYEAFESTMYASTSYVGYNWSFMIPDSRIKNLLYSGIVFAALFLLNNWMKKNPAGAKKLEKALFVSLILAYLCAGIFYALTSPYYPTGDQINTTAGAAYALEGNYLMFSPLGYIDICPHQKGLLFFYEICFKVFGSFNYTPVRIITVIMNTLTIIMGHRLIKDFGGKEFAGILYTVFMVTCAPYFLLIPYAYGDLPSIFGIMVMVYFFHRYFNGGNFLNVLISAVGGIFAILNRSAAWIAVFALIITALFLTLKKGKMYALACTLFIALVSYLALTSINIRYEKLSGYDRHTGSPTIAYIAMGMQATGGAPGVYNRYHQNLYEKYDGNKEHASAEAREYIRARFEEFKADPDSAYEFYKAKTVYQWNDPMFEWNTHMYSFRPDTVLEGFYDSLYRGAVHDTIFKFMNRYQAFIYLLCLIMAVKGLIMVIKNDRSVIFYWFFHIFVIGGFLFSLIWEAKARYSLPYFVFMIPVAVMLFSPMNDKKS